MRNTLLPLAALALAQLCDVTTAWAVPKPEIQVSTVDELYAAVQPANAHTVVRLASGTYTLRPATRLILPPGMDLIGVRRVNGSESKIVMPAPLAGAGVVVIGDHNAVRWITVEAPVFGPAREAGLGQTPAVTACMEVSIMPTAEPGIGMSAEVSDSRFIGATRGIRVYHAGAPATSPGVGRHSTVFLERNESIDQGDGFGFGVQVQNFVNDSILEVDIRNSLFTGSRYGIFMVSITGPNHATNIVHSRENVFSNNISGAALFGGRDAVNLPFLDSFRGATNSRSEFTSIKDRFINNVGDELASLGASGGISAVGGFRTSDHTTPVTGNQVELTLVKTTFEGNMADGVYRDLTVFGGLGAGTEVPNGGNSAVVHLDRVRTERSDTFVFVDSAPSQPVNEPPNTITVTQTDEDCCDGEDD